MFKNKSAFGSEFTLKGMIFSKSPNLNKRNKNSLGKILLEHLPSRIAVQGEYPV